MVLDSVKRWIATEQSKHLKCECGCGQEIIIQEWHKWSAIPKFINTHYSKTKFAREMVSIKTRGHIKSKETRQKSSLSQMKKIQAGIQINSYGKRCYYTSPLQGQVCFRSSYELAYAKYLDSIHELWMYEMETFDLNNASYTPDFFLPRKEKFVEIKGYMLPKAQEKINQFKEQYPWDLEILFKEDLKILGAM